MDLSKEPPAGYEYRHCKNFSKSIMDYPTEYCAVAVSYPNTYTANAIYTKFTIADGLLIFTIALLLCMIWDRR